MVLFPPPFYFVFYISNFLSYIKNNFSYELARPIMGTIFLVFLDMKTRNNKGGPHLLIHMQREIHVISHATQHACCQQIYPVTTSTALKYSHFLIVVFVYLFSRA